MNSLLMTVAPGSLNTGTASSSALRRSAPKPRRSRMSVRRASVRAGASDQSVCSARSQAVRVRCHSATSSSPGPAATSRSRK